jgi:hypothetical protein
VKIVYHCFSCDEDFGDIETAEGHSKSLSHEVNESLCSELRASKVLIEKIKISIK